uniref:SFRICE_015387 n=1 Tax=Spodoptera frugiperda TaxID=7108 RepID=A0A2H1V7W3_SPOFR
MKVRLIVLLVLVDGAMLRHKWASSTGVIPRPHRKPTWSNACVLFRYKDICCSFSIIIRQYVDINCLIVVLRGGPRGRPLFSSGRLSADDDDDDETASLAEWSQVRLPRGLGYDSRVSTGGADRLPSGDPSACLPPIP